MWDVNRKYKDCELLIERIPECWAASRRLDLSGPTGSGEPPADLQRVWEDSVHESREHLDAASVFHLDGRGSDSVRSVLLENLLERLIFTWYQNV